MVQPAPPKTKSKTTDSVPYHGNDRIKQVTQLKRRERSEEALSILSKLASLVKPIMNNHGFRVGTLCEFFPKDARLLGLNVNHGMKICIRLRPASDEKSFLPMESIIGTMLHELTHNKYGPHNQTFYKFLDGLQNEFDKLLMSGYTGEGFYSKGHVVGAGVSHNVSPAEAKKRAVAAAQKRAELYKGSGQKLGTADGIKKKQTKPLSVLIREAAERRAADAKWCASQRQDVKTEDLGEDSDVELLENFGDNEKPTANKPSKRPVVLMLDSDDSDEPPSQSLKTDFVDLTDN
ncbi:hypothetical protein TRICI_003300 [Trichomonascus ciferrii]|uniref:WLM domain-containing protein n=1 Tax=Trichomonascus ciferrii TaxID=44093 RepID=A0A642V3I8_9ASCO|nr:hypothetical protein TRICI_003300 [Trichomonascus ciferrii]